MTLIRRTSVVMLGLLLWPGLAWADPKDDARRHFLAGLQSAQQGDYQAALAEFLKAQEVWPHPNTLYNIAKAYADLGDLPNALAYYRLFREAAPERAADVDPVIAVLEARLQPAEAPKAPTPPTAPPTPLVSTEGTVDVARLEALVQELDSLTRQLRGGAPVASPLVTPPVTPPTETPVAPDTTKIPETGEFIADAYEQEVVTASRYGQAPLDSPSTVTVLSTEDIQLSGATTLPDLLRRVAGVEVMQLSAAQPDLSIRGFNRELSNKVLVLIDGRSVYQDFLGNVLWATLPIGLDDIERIEIIRGPGSAIYGANAVTGVINLITRRPGEGQNRVSVQGGSPNYANASASLTGKKDAISWRFGGGYTQLQHWSIEAPITEDGPLIAFSEDQDTSEQVLRANGRVDLALPQQGLFSLSGGYAGGFTEFYTLGALGDYGFDFQSGHLRADLGIDPIHLRVFLNHLSGIAGPWQYYRGEPSLRTVLSTNVLDSEAEWLETFETGPVKHHANIGLGYRYKTMSWDYLVGEGTPIDEHHFAVFAQEDARIGPLGIVGSLRMDKHPLVPLSQTLSPRAALIYRAFPHTALRLTGGTSFRSPTFLESYLELEQPTAADGYYVVAQGDTSLLPEHIATGEFGIHDESTRFHNADVAVYINRVTQLIDLTALSPTLSPFNPDQQGFQAGTTGFANLPEIWTAYGAEGELSLFPSDGLELYGNLDIERILADNGSEVVVDQSTSAFKVNAGIHYSSHFRMDFATDISWASEQSWRLRSYDAQGQLITQTEDLAQRLIVSGRIAGRPLKDDSLELALGIWNLGALVDAPFREHPKGQLVGGRIYGSLGWRF